MPDPVPDYDVVIVGAGASGLAAAIFVAETAPAVRVGVLDSARRVGAKILISGGGRCNIGNSRLHSSDYHGARRPITRILARFDQHETIQWFDSLGVAIKEEEHGKLFPQSDSARAVLSALLARCWTLGVTILTGHRVTAARVDADGFLIRHERGELTCAHLVLAAGGRSIPKSGSDGSGWTLARAFGHTVTDCVPALVPLKLAPSFFHSRLSGVTHEAAITTRVNQATVDQRRGSLLWTHFGVSGPVVMDASRFWSLATARGEQPTLHLSLLPGETRHSVTKWLVTGSRTATKQTLGRLLSRRLPHRLVESLCHYVEHTARRTPSVPISAPMDSLQRTPPSRLSRIMRDRLIAALTELPLPVTQSRGWNHAEVTAGGVPLKEVDPYTMESRRVPNLFIIGEMLDCDGRIGGFNFQWAWATGYVASTGIIKKRTGRSRPSTSVRQTKHASTRTNRDD